VDELKPDFAVWENVPGALSSNSGRDFATALSEFRRIRARDIAWRIIDAQYCGVAQRRRRVFLVADFRGERAAKVLFEQESYCRDVVQDRKKQEKITDSIEKSLVSKAEKYLVWSNGQGHPATGYSNVAYSLNCSGNMGIGTRKYTPLEYERLQGFPDGWTSGQRDSIRYKQLGNSVAVPIAEWLGGRILGAYKEF
jgi:DNA (cytosine-5)-methyltransferase 1